MNNSLQLLREIALRLVAAVVGYFVIFSAYLFLFAAYSKHMLSVPTILHISASTLTIPFIDILRNPILLIRLLRAPDVTLGQTSHTAIIKILSISLAMEVILFVALIAIIIVFERSAKTRASIVFFYLCIPALLWLIWSQLYVLFG